MTLTLRVMRAVSLPAKDFSGTSDPYVKIMLLPDKKTKLQTNIKRRNLNPRWNELFAFEGEPPAGGGRGGGWGVGGVATLAGMPRVRGGVGSGDFIGDVRGVQGKWGVGTLLGM